MSTAATPRAETTGGGAAPAPSPPWQTDLVAFLRDKLEGDWTNVQLRQFVGGQSNPTFRIDAGERSYVLRKKPGGKLLPSAHAIEREYRVMAALRDHGVPVPAMRLLSDDESVVGTPFFVMDFVPGRVIADPAVPGVALAERAAIYDAMGMTIAAVHSVDLAAAGLSDFGRPRGFYPRQVKRWTEQYRASETETIPAMEKLIAWLPEHLPPDGTPSLVHGDLRLENLLIHPIEPRVVAVLDWELSTLGDPLGDLAYNCLPWHLPPEAFGGLVGRAGECAGLPSEAEYLARYCARTGRAGIDGWNFYVAFALFRLAAILQGVLKRALAGNSSSPDALDRGRLAGVCATAGWAAAVRP
jgi:aminoglycoside phosphotransferase (APT) family kinase protein